MDMDDHSPRFRMLAGFTIVLVVIGGLWAAFTLLWPEDDGRIAMLKADAAPYKVKPDQPGGMQIPHQDKLVFNAVSNEGKMVTVERILPPPEQPVGEATPPVTNVIQEAATLTQQQMKAQQAPSTAPLPQQQAAAAPQAKEQVQLATEPLPVAMGRGNEAQKAPAPQKTIDTPAAFDMAKGTAQPKKPQAPPQPEVKVEKPAAETEAPAAQAKQEETPAETKTAEPAEDPKKDDVKEKAAEAPADNVKDNNDAPETDAAPASSGKARFQIASFFDRPSAEKALPQFKSKYADALNGAAISIIEASLPGGKKVFRVQGGAADTASAGKICAGIKAKGGTCVLAH